MTINDQNTATKLDIMRLERRIQEHSKLLRVLEENEVVKMLRDMEGSILALEYKLNTMRIKQDVVTEVSLSCRPGDKVAMMAVMAIDKPDRWWRERAGRSIDEWRDEIAALPVDDICWQRALGIADDGGVRTVDDLTVYE